MYNISLKKNNHGFTQAHTLYVPGFTHTRARHVSGFTLIEVMVAVSIFAIVVTVGIGALMTVNKGYRQAQVQRAAIDNISFTMEAMAREIRVGQQYTCGNTTPLPVKFNCSDNAFSFVSFDINNNTISYEVSDDYLTYYLDTTTDAIYQRSGSGNNALRLTSTNVKVSKLAFIVNELDGASPKQPYVSIHITAQAADANQQSDIVLQTSVSQRLLVQ
ncbi:MAG: prepilin-type N-terminal cleavage/methylation domain-containing protein [Candidatus Pacebacteria bacterium]|nr:prepilin-type N-terminal cleavage/methylation domain-containing protein [Candidatus Paceibacterota bacterium]